MNARGKLIRLRLVTIIALLCAGADRPPTRPAAGHFTNPITARDAADPWIAQKDGWYYFTATLDPEGGLWVWKSRAITGIDEGQKVKVWTAPRQGPQSRQIWAPELHFLDGKWYLYYTASDGNDRNHRHYVLESETDDPLGKYVDRGRVDPELESFAIDGSVLRLPDGRLYWMYTTRDLEIAPMTNPWTVDGSRRAKLAAPTHPWERGWVEAPQALFGPDGKLFIVYSAGHSGTPHYVLGLLEHTGGDVLDPASWKKHPLPVFAPHVGGGRGVYTTGHCCFAKSPDGTEDWILYHAKEWRDVEDAGFRGRTTRAQRFTWREDGAPNFGEPAQVGEELKVPSGERSIDGRR